MGWTPSIPMPVTFGQAGAMGHLLSSWAGPYEPIWTWFSSASEPDEVQWRYLALVFTRTTPATTSEDVAQIGFHIVNITSGVVDTSWTTADHTVCEAAVNEWWGGVRANMSNSHVLKELRWYIKLFNPNLPDGAPANSLDPATGKPYLRFQNSGPAERIVPKNEAANGVGTALPYQNAMSITFKTNLPAHWGRVYLPGIQTGQLSTTNGRFSSTIVSGMANQTAELADDLAVGGFHLVVPTTQAGGKFHTALQTVTQIQVDDIPDVIRRRRAKQPTLRTIGVPVP